MNRAQFLKKLVVGVAAVALAPQLLAKESIQAGNVFEMSVATSWPTRYTASSLEDKLRMLTFDMKDVKLWEAMPKLQAFNTVEEYNQLIVGSYEEEFLTEWPSHTMISKEK